MISTETYWTITRILATVALISQNVYYSIVQPGPMDTINGAITGIVVYAIWFAREKKPKKIPPHLQEFSDVQE
jgi:hypothetical protein